MLQKENEQQRPAWLQSLWKSWLLNEPRTYLTWESGLDESLRRFVAVWDKTHEASYERALSFDRLLESLNLLTQDFNVNNT